MHTTAAFLQCACISSSVCVCWLYWISFTSSCVSVFCRSVICLWGRVDLQQHNKKPKLAICFLTLWLSRGPWRQPPAHTEQRAIRRRLRQTHTHVNVAPAVLLQLFCLVDWLVDLLHQAAALTDPSLVIHAVCVNKSINNKVFLISQFLHSSCLFLFFLLDKIISCECINIP